MTELPNTTAPAMPSFAMVKTDLPVSAFNEKAHKLHWQPVHVVDFYRRPDADMHLRRIRMETAE